MNTATTNHAGFAKSDYEGQPSTLCKGCGHDNITRHIITAYYEMGINPYDVVKPSGIGCSSKTPAYFIHRGYGINSVHGRMPSVSLGAKLANGNLQVVGISGDGDSASIGMGQFCHAVRRNLDMVYVVENNGVYGLTKGQFSATADRGSTLKTGDINSLEDIDLCATAITLNGTFVARAYSNDAKQLRAMIKASIAHRGTSLLDVISPCVTFNNHEGSTKSISYVKEHDVHLNQVGFVPHWEQDEVELKAGEASEIRLPDGSQIVVRQVRDNYDPTDRIAALQVLREVADQGEILTGLIYVSPQEPDFNTISKLNATKGLCHYDEADLRPTKEQMSEYLASYR